MATCIRRKENLQNKIHISIQQQQQQQQLNAKTVRTSARDVTYVNVSDLNVGK